VNPVIIGDALTWDCGDGTPDEDHCWRLISDWYGDPGVINGTADCSYMQCRYCGKQREPTDNDWANAASGSPEDDL
jgi:hypothetical protein